jgi:hypothetical protein
LITIHYDYTDGTEISFFEGKNTKDSFSTNCLQFFNNDEPQNVKILRKNGDYIIKSDLFNDNFHTDKEIRQGHNILKIFLANGLRWKTVEALEEYIANGYTWDVKDEVPRL